RISSTAPPPCSTLFPYTTLFRSLTERHRFARCMFDLAQALKRLLLHLFCLAVLLPVIGQHGKQVARGCNPSRGLCLLPGFARHALGRGVFPLGAIGCAEEFAPQTVVVDASVVANLAAACQVIFGQGKLAAIEREVG